jgi:hypothetical protein
MLFIYFLFRRDNDNNNDKSCHSISQDVLRAFNQLNATTATDEPEIETNEICSLRNKSIDRGTKCHSLTDTLPRDFDTSAYGSHDDPLSSSNNRVCSKVTFESLVTQNSVPSSPKTKDQSVMAQIDIKGRLNYPNNNLQEQIQENNDNKNGLTMPIISEGTVTSGSLSPKSSVKELVRNPKPANHRKSKSQNRARKALRTITFILGMFHFIFRIGNLSSNELHSVLF